jgi:crossover junction endodeoxyribonuclease RuvC
MPETPGEIFVALLKLVSVATVRDGIHVYMEKSQPMPKQGVSSVYNYGHHNGFLEGVLKGLCTPYTLIKPQAWQKVLHAGADSKLELKARSIQVCQRLFPSVSLLPTPRCKKPSDGMAEALLIAEYGRRTLQGAAAP